jgi:hypothetical protein
MTVTTTCHAQGGGANRGNDPSPSMPKKSQQLHCNQLLEHPPECDFHTHSVMFTRRVRFLHAECSCHMQCDFDTHTFNSDTHDCVFYTQSVISTRRVWFLHVECSYTRRVRFPYVECDFYTQSVISRRSVILTRKNVLTIRTRVFLHADCDSYMQSTHAKWDFYTQSLIFTRTNVIKTLTTAI